MMGTIAGERVGWKPSVFRFPWGLGGQNEKPMVLNSPLNNFSYDKQRSSYAYVFFILFTYNLWVLEMFGLGPRWGWAN